MRCIAPLCVNEPLNYNIAIKGADSTVKTHNEHERPHPLLQGHKGQGYICFDVLNYAPNR